MPSEAAEATDEHLVARARAGVPAAFDALVRRHHGRIYGLTYGMMRNSADAAELTQDAFFSAYRKLDSFRGDASFTSWLHRIATNACLMRLRSRRRKPEVPLDPRSSPDDDTPAPHADPEDPAPPIDRQYENRELGRVIFAAMEELPPSYRAVFVLADLQHHTMKEIAEILDITVPNTKSRLHRARLRLRERLRPYLAADPRAATNL